MKRVCALLWTAATFAAMPAAQPFKFDLSHLDAKASSALDLSLNHSTLQFAAKFLDGHLSKAAFEGQMTDEALPGGRAGNLFEPVPGRFGAHGRFDRGDVGRSNGRHSAECLQGNSGHLTSRRRFAKRERRTGSKCGPWSNPRRYL